MTIKLTPPPVPNKLLEAFSDQINQEKIFIEKNSNFIFVCGSNSKDSCREKFLEFAEKQRVIVKSGVWGLKRRPCLADLYPERRL